MVKEPPAPGRWGCAGRDADRCRPLSDGCRRFPSPLRMPLIRMLRGAGRMDQFRASRSEGDARETSGHDSGAADPPGDEQIPGLPSMQTRRTHGGSPGRRCVGL